MSTPSLYENNCAVLGVGKGQTAGYNQAVAHLIQLHRNVCNTQRAQLAAHAPEVPSRYVPVPCASLPEEPKIGENDSAEGYAAWATEHSAWENRCAQLNEEHRIVSWRFHYADLMLAELLKGTK